MKPFDPIIVQVLRRFIMVIGFSFFVIFAYKATQDVSNRALASGSPFRKKPPIASLSTQPVSQTTSSYHTPALSIGGSPAGGSDENANSDKGEKPSSNATSIKTEKTEAEYLQNVEPVKPVTKKSSQVR